MLNQTGTKKTIYNAESEILVDIQNHTAVSIIVSDEGVTAGADGKKILYAGQPVYGDLMDRDTPFTASAKTTGQDTSAVTTKVVGVLRHMVDVTEGNANSQAVIFGTVDISKVETNTAAKLKAVASDLKMVQLIK